MKYYILIILFIASTMSVKAEDSWKTYRYEEQGFEIKFYEEPVFEKKSNIEDGKEYENYIIENIVEDTTHEIFSYTLLTLEFDNDFIHSDSSFKLVEILFDNSQESNFKDTNIKLLNMNIEENQGYPSKVYTYNKLDYDILRTEKLILVENILYCLIISGYNLPKSEEYINKFYDSFKITNKLPGNFKVPSLEFEVKLSVEFPSKVEEEFVVNELEPFKIPLYSRYSVSYGKDSIVTIYQTREADYPEQANISISQYNKDLIYTDGLRQYLKDEEASIKYFKKIDLFGYEGVEYIISMHKSKREYKYRSVIIGNKYYTINVLYSPNDGREGEREKFFNSFKIKE